LDDLALYFLFKVENAQGSLMNKRASGGAGVEEINIFNLMIYWGVGMAINNGVDLIKFSPDS
jgi:hypothetical protein